MKLNYLQDSLASTIKEPATEKALDLKIKRTSQSGVDCERDKVIYND